MIEEKEETKIEKQKIVSNISSSFECLSKYNQNYFNQLNMLLKGLDFGYMKTCGQILNSHFNSDWYKEVNKGVISAVEIIQNPKIQESIRGITSSISTASSIVGSYSNSINGMLKGLTLNSPFNDSWYKGINKSILSVVEGIQGLQIQESIRGITNSISIASSIVESYNESIRSMLNGISSSLATVFKDINFEYIDRLMPYNVDTLKRFYWVIPYEYSQKQIDNITGVKVIDFNKKMLRYFTPKRVKRLFNAVARYSQEPNKKRFIRQCEKNYFDGAYALCITGLITYLDGLTLDLLDDVSRKQHMSYKIISGLKKEYGEATGIGNYIKYLRICVADNFYNQFYDNQDLKNNNRRKIARSLNSHGVRYTNSKIDALRIVNAIRYTQEIINDVNDLKSSFIIKNISIGNGNNIPFAVLNIQSSSIPSKP